jgi:hypothetical protein
MGAFALIAIALATLLPWKITRDDSYAGQPVLQAIMASLGPLPANDRAKHLPAAASIPQPDPISHAPAWTNDGLPLNADESLADLNWVRANGTRGSPPAIALPDWVSR